MSEFNTIVGSLMATYPLVAALAIRAGSGGPDLYCGRKFHRTLEEQIVGAQTITGMTLASHLFPITQWAAYVDERPVISPIHQLRMAERIGRDLLTGEPVDQSEMIWSSPTGLLALIDDNNICDCIDRGYARNFGWRSLVHRIAQCWQIGDLLDDARHVKGLDPDIVLAGEDLFRWWVPQCTRPRIPFGLMPVITDAGLLGRVAEHDGALVVLDDRMPARTALTLGSATIAVAFRQERNFSLDSRACVQRLTTNVRQICFAPARNAKYTNLEAQVRSKTP